MPSPRRAAELGHDFGLRGHATVLLQSVLLRLTEFLRRPRHYNYWLQYIGLNYSTIKYLGTDLAEFTPGQTISLTGRVRYDRQDRGRLDIESEFASKPDP